MSSQKRDDSYQKSAHVSRLSEDQVGLMRQEVYFIKGASALMSHSNFMCLASDAILQRCRDLGITEDHWDHAFGHNLAEAMIKAISDVGAHLDSKIYGVPRYHVSANKEEKKQDEDHPEVLFHVPDKN